MFLVPAAILEGMLNAALQLRGALSSVTDPKLRPDLDQLLRRVFVAHVLAQNWVVAIGGSQGAGKTTLVRQLYNMDNYAVDWLPANEGQGERLPVLLQESADVTAPQGWVHKLMPSDESGSTYCVRLEPVDLVEFRRATRGDDPSLLLPVLKVPPRHFQAVGATLLLLPGYEHRHRQNAIWQELMRQALAAAGGCVIVTDQTKLADSTSQDILRDQELSGAEPVVVITKTEEASEALRGELCRRATDVFKGSGGQVAGVFCTGVGAEFTEYWSGKLVEGIASAANSANRVQGLRVKHLTELLDDLRLLLGKVEEELAARHDNADDVWDRVVGNQLDPYEKAVVKLRSSYLRQLTSALAAHHDEASKHLLRTIKPDEGVGGWLFAKFRTTSERLERQRELIEQAWRAPGDCQQCHLQALTYATFEKLNGPGVTMLPRQTFSQGTALIARTGYEGVKDSVWSALPPTAGENLRILLSSGDEGNLSEGANGDIALLPALALEFSRLAELAELPTLEYKALRITSEDGLNVPETVAQTKANFKELMGIHNELVGAIGTVFGVKEDGNLQTVIRDIRGKLPTGTGAGRTDRMAGGLLLAADIFVGGVGVAAVAAAAVVAVGLLVRAAEKEQLSQAETVLTALEEAHRLAYLSSFDDVINKVRDRLTEVLRARYKFDQDIYERDRVAVAARRLQRMADVLDRALPSLT